MPLYEIVCIARAGMSNSAMRRLLRNSALHVLDNNGVVRAFEPMGKDLPLYSRIKKGEWHTRGTYWAMQFDSKPETMKTLSRLLSLDDFVLRHTIIKLGNSLTAKSF
ncbi:ribosomal protein S6 [Hyaloraphidium curvatum]|nr:ribosomal protein S6 [Hyaloraphidium curvatum]